MKIFIVTARKSEKWFTYASDSEIFQTLSPFLSVQPSMKVKHLEPALFFCLCSSVIALIALVAEMFG